MEVKSEKNVVKPEKNEVIIKPLIWEDASDDKEEDIVPIRVWGLDREGKSVCIRIEDFPNFYWVELPREVQGQRIIWTEQLASEVIHNIASRSKNFSEDWILETQFPPCGKETLYYFKLDPNIPMVCVFFKSMKAGNIFAGKLKYDQHILDYGKARLLVHENNNSKLPITLKLRALKKIAPCQWIKVQAVSVPSRQTISTSQEYIARWNEVDGIPLTETTEWPFEPVIMAVDGEMYSDKPEAMPDKHIAKHCCFMWSCVVKRYKAKTETTKRYCIVLGECDQIPPDKLENSEIILVDNEVELMNKYGELCQKEDPDIIMGFNIYGFDNPYLNFRVERQLKSLPVLGRIKGQISTYKEQLWESRAYNEMPINYFTTPGRIMLDLLTYFKRSPQKFSQYKLDTIAYHYLGETKKDMSAKNMFRIYGSYLDIQDKKLTDPKEYQRLVQPIKEELQEVALYCIQDSELLLKLTDYINIVTDITELANVVQINPLNTVISGQTVRCIAQIYFLCSNINIVINDRTADVKSFTGGAVGDPKVGLEDLVLCWDFASMYPSIMRAFNIDYTTLIPESIVNKLDPSSYYKAEFQQEEEEDDIEEAEAEFEYNQEFDDNGKEKKKKKKDKIKVIKKYVYYWYQKRKGVLPTLVEKLVNERNSVRKLMAQDQKVLDKYIADDNKLSELLSLAERDSQQEEELQYLMDTIEDRKKEIFRYKVRINVEESQQLGLKVSGNSMYGFIGAKFGLPLQEGSRTVTAMGRMLIGKITEYVSTYYRGSAVYGDTDSTMMTIPYITSSDQMYYWGTKIAEEVNKGIPPGGTDALGNVLPEGRKALLQDPMKIEYEKGMRIMCFKKKKYAALLYDKKGNLYQDDVKNEKGIVVGKTDTMLTRGIVLSRRDNCEYLRDTYHELLYDILHQADMISVYQKMFNKIHLLLTDQVPFEKLVIVKSCRSTYAKESNAMNIFVNNLKRDNKIVNGGDRLEYVIVQDPDYPGWDKVGFKKRSVEQFLERKGTPKEEPLDTSWYVAKHLKNPLDQLLSVGYRKEIDYIKQHTGSFRLDNKSKKVLHLDTPLEIIATIVKSGQSHLYFGNWFNHIMSKVVS